MKENLKEEEEKEQESVTLQNILREVNLMMNLLKEKLFISMVVLKLNNLAKTEEPESKNI